MQPETVTAEHLAYYLIAANFIAFATFGIDKALAEAGARRISEATLLTWALVGGTPGAYAARHLFRHKTRKQPFSNELHFIAGLQAVVLFLGFTLGWDTLGQFLQSLFVDER
jgi:uncharacterized membrane protein YsdA (DUF1294 family)